MKFPNKIAQLKPSLTLAITSKAKEMKADGVDIVGFGAGEPDFDTPESIKNAGILAIKEGKTKYTPASGTAELKSAICKKFKKDNALVYSPEEVAISCGAKHALYNIFQVMCDSDDEILIISPYWLSYTEMVRLSGAREVLVEAHEKNNFVINPDDVARKITQKTKAIIVNSPSNPTGAVYGKEVLSEIAKIAVEKDIFVISDEIYEKLIYDGERHVSIGALNDKVCKKTLTVNGVSKTYSMTGWRIGYVAGDARIIAKIAALQSHSTSNPSSISQVAALEALNGKQDEMEKMVKEFESRRNFMASEINKMDKISCVSPKGAFYVFCNIEKTGLDSLQFTERLLLEAHVACVPGIPFGSDKHIRLSFATSLDNIKKGLERIEKWSKKL